MSYQEIKNVVSLISTVCIFGGYCAYVFLNNRDEIWHSTATLSFWGAVVLILIPVSIVARIVVTILFIMIYRMVTKEQEPSFADELDKLIELKASRVSYAVFVVGFLFGMFALAMEWPLSWAFVFMICSGFMAEVADGVAQLYWYRKGI
ncbi:hypothetical protein [Cohnella panacarvi]|uniref:hypothetical protein n=1 Tax=Cohnella panacarvi TaxID=400776 RepID=UPI00047D85E8|nr:hypothetical protein [Cohnella panacarvi]